MIAVHKYVPARNAPVFDVDRSRAQYVGLTTRDVTNSLVVNLAGSGQVTPTYWLNPDTGITYNIVLQTPQYRLDSLAALSSLPIMAPATPQLQVLGAVSDIHRDTANAVVSHYDLQGLVQVSRHHWTMGDDQRHTCTSPSSARLGRSAYLPRWSGMARNQSGSNLASSICRGVRAKDLSESKNEPAPSEAGAVQAGQTIIVGPICAAPFILICRRIQCCETTSRGPARLMKTHGCASDLRYCGCQPEPQPDSEPALLPVP